jgi:hypothetical protein
MVFDQGEGSDILDAIVAEGPLWKRVARLGTAS